MIQLTLINLHPNEYSQEFHYYPFAVKLDKCIGSCNTPNDLSNKLCVPNKTEGLNLSVFNMITGIQELKALRKYISCGWKCKFNGKNCNSDQWWNYDKCQCECKIRHVCGKDYVWNLAKPNCKNEKYLASIMDDLAIMLDDQTNFNEKKIACIFINYYSIIDSC